MSDSALAGQGEAGVKRNPWRPAKYESAKDMQAGIVEYLHDCEISKKPPTLAGLALWLGFADRRSLLDYKSRGEDFSRTIAVAKSFIEVDRNERLALGVPATGLMFDLRCNHAWSDKSDSDKESGGSSIIVVKVIDVGEDDDDPDTD